MRILAELLSPLEEGEHEQDRPNLKLKCKNASIAADVWVEDVVDGDEESVRDVKGKVVIDVSSYNGSASVNLVRANCNYHSSMSLIRVQQDGKPSVTTSSNQSNLTKRIGIVGHTVNVHRTAQHRFKKRKH